MSDLFISFVAWRRNRWIWVWLSVSIVPVVPFTLPLFNQALSNSPTAYLVWIPILAFGWSFRNLRYIETSGESKGDRSRWIGRLLSVFIVLFWVSGSYFFGETFFRYDIGLLLWGPWAISVACAFWGRTAFSAIWFPMGYLLGGWPPLYLTLLNWVNPLLWKLAIYLLLHFSDGAHWIQYVSNGFFSVINRTGAHTIVEVSYGCSGSDSVLAILVLFPILFVILKGRLVQKILLLFWGCLLAFALNLVRIFVIVLGLHWIGYRFAFDVLHPLLGTVFFVIVILVLSAVGLKSPAPKERTERIGQIVLTGRFPGVVLVSAFLATVTLSPLYWQSAGTPIRPLVLGTSSVNRLFPSISGFREVAARPLPGESDAVSRLYSNGNEQVRVTMWINGNLELPVALTVTSEHVAPGIVGKQGTVGITHGSVRVQTDYSLVVAYQAQRMYLHILTVYSLTQVRRVGAVHGEAVRSLASLDTPSAVRDRAERWSQRFGQLFVQRLLQNH